MYNLVYNHYQVIGTFIKLYLYKSQKLFMSKIKMGFRKKK